MLTGRRAFDAPSVAAILARVTGKDPAPPSTVAPSVPPVVDDLVARALAKEASARYATGRMMSEDLEDVLAGRDPRHRAGWIPSPRAEDTIRTPAPEPTADLRTPPAREGSLVLRLAERVGGRGVAVLVALLAAGIGLPLVARHSDSLPLTLPLPSLASSVLDPGHLEISFDHPLRSGTLRVYVDDEQVVEEAFTGKVTKKILSFRLRRGSSRQVLDVAPGEHVIRVEVDGAGFEGARRIRGTFKSGETRHLDATVDGIIKRELTLEWGT
jgi:hypothetical protein